MAGGAEQDDLGVFQQRLKIRHGADADKDQQGKNFGEHAGVIKKTQEPFLAHHVSQRNVYEDGAEADRHEEKRFVTFFDTKIEQR